MRKKSTNVEKFRRHRRARPSSTMEEEEEYGDQWVSPRPFGLLTSVGDLPALSLANYGDILTVVGEPLAGIRPGFRKNFTVLV
ncbi:hypothetical protein Dimus_033857 [Dionaea muscipula]